MANFIFLKNDSYNSPVVAKLNDYNNAIQQAIKCFKEFYSRFDKRLLTTKKKVNVNIKGHILNVNIDFNKVHYSQCYEIVNYNEIKGQQINY